MQTYARIVDGAVVELLTSAVPPAKRFHPSLAWVDVTSQPVAVGWLQTPGGFVPPPAPAAAAAPLPSLAQLQAQLAELSAQVAALAAH